MDNKKIIPDHWTWTKKYSTWEASSHNFLYPENWLQESDSAPMVALENELLRTDLAATSKEIRADIFALTLIGTGIHGPAEFNTLSQTLLNAETPPEHLATMSREQINKYLHAGLWKLIREAIAKNTKKRRRTVKAE